MTNEAMVEILKDLKTQWGILKDESKAKIDRRQACKLIIALSDLAKKNDPKFEVIEMNNTKYAEFVPTTYKVQSNVNWGEEVVATEAEQTALDKLKRLEAIAVQEIKIKLPKESDDSQKFGMIVSAYTDKLIRIYTFQNS
jgi:hypothetical protein|tara:strand:+ start:854 stop:1273 length:420 start_codon:yes stop_codon:yes gene_type:complete